MKVKAIAMANFWKNGTPESLMKAREIVPLLSIGTIIALPTYPPLSLLLKAKKVSLSKWYTLVYSNRLLSR